VSIARDHRLAAEVAARIGSCPSADELSSAREGDLMEHLASCKACSEALAMLDGSESADAEALEELPPDVEQRSERLIRAATSDGTSRRGWGVLSAVAAIALVAVGVWLLRDTEVTQPVYRDSQYGIVRTLLAEGRALPREDFLLRWSAVDGVSHYDLEVATEALEPIVRAEGLTEPEYVVSPAELVELPSGARLIWQVDAVYPGGRTIRSTTFVTPLE
jgi:hypothetical protein